MLPLGIAFSSAKKHAIVDVWALSVIFLTNIWKPCSRYSSIFSFTQLVAIHLTSPLCHGIHICPSSCANVNLRLGIYVISVFIITLLSFNCEYASIPYWFSSSTIWISISEKILLTSIGGVKSNLSAILRANFLTASNLFIWLLS